MAKISVADVVVHIDESLDSIARGKLENDLREQEGVMNVQFSEKAPHLMVVKFDPDHARCKDILSVVLGDHLHAELVGI